MISCVSEAGKVEGEDGSEVKFWSVFYERNMLIAGGGRTGKEKATFHFFFHKEGQRAAQKKALNPETRC